MLRTQNPSHLKLRTSFFFSTKLFQFFKSVLCNFFLSVCMFLCTCTCVWGVCPLVCACGECMCICVGCVYALGCGEIFFVSFLLTPLGQVSHWTRGWAGSQLAHVTLLPHTHTTALGVTEAWAMTSYLLSKCSSLLGHIPRQPLKHLNEHFIY